jgi:hypothetical protein
MNSSASNTVAHNASLEEFFITEQVNQESLRNALASESIINIINNNSRALCTTNDILYKMNDEKFDQTLMSKKYAFFEEKKGFENTDIFAPYNTLSKAARAAFRKYYIYELDGEFEMSVDEFLELSHFLNYTCIDKHTDYINNLPRMRRYLHENRANKLLMQKTILIHMITRYIFDNDGSHEEDSVNMICIVLNIDYLSLSWKEKYEIFKNGTDPLHRHMTAYCLAHGIGCEVDKTTAKLLYYSNWCDNTFTYSFGNYCYILTTETNISIDFPTRELLLQIYISTRCPTILAELAHCYRDGINGLKNNDWAYELYWLNWQTNRYTSSLHYVVSCLEKMPEPDLPRINKLIDLHNSLVRRE